MAVETDQQVSVDKLIAAGEEEESFITYFIDPM